MKIKLEIEVKAESLHFYKLWLVYMKNNFTSKAILLYRSAIKRQAKISNSIRLIENNKNNLKKKLLPGLIREATKHH